MLRARVRDWVFDLDNTLYPLDSTLYDAIGDRMTAYIAATTGLNAEDAVILRERYFVEYGATVVGLVRHHGVDATHFLGDVHNVDQSLVHPDAELRALIQKLPGRKFVFTNGGGGHPERILKRLELDDLFDGVFDIEFGGLSPKPERDGYERLVAHFGLEPAHTILVEDTLRNLMPADELGFLTALVGPVHPEPRPAYVHHYAHDVKALLADFLDIAPASA
ncbi:MAG TPA: pyrimidine 5'-nucleotidase [Caulobacterales bacterium]|nr:pyrimidine 5'-nucleotidase [Caulobacterales bacterium]